MDRRTRGPVNKPSLRAERKRTENKRQKEIQRYYSYFMNFSECGVGEVKPKRMRSKIKKERCTHKPMKVSLNSSYILENQGGSHFYSFIKGNKQSRALRLFLTFHKLKIYTDPYKPTKKHYTHIVSHQKRLN